MKKNYLLMGATLGVICILFITLIGSLLIKKTHIQMNILLQDNIKNTIATTDTIDFSKITNFEWDTLYVFTPYSSPTEIFKEDNIVNFNYQFPIEFSDTIIMLGFVKDHHFVNYVELPIEYFSDLPPTSIRFTPDTAHFKVGSKSETHPSTNVIYLFE